MITRAQKLDELNDRLSEFGAKIYTMRFGVTAGVELTPGVTFFWGRSEETRVWALRISEGANTWTILEAPHEYRLAAAFKSAQLLEALHVAVDVQLRRIQEAIDTLNKTMESMSA